LGTNRRGEKGKQRKKSRSQKKGGKESMNTSRREEKKKEVWVKIGKETKSDKSFRQQKSLEIRELGQRERFTKTQKVDKS